MVCADQLAGRLEAASRPRQRGQGAPGVAGRGLHQQVKRPQALRRTRKRGVIDRALYYPRGCPRRQRPQLQDQRRDSSGAYENDGFSVVAATNSTTHHCRQRGVLLGLGKSVPRR